MVTAKCIVLERRFEGVPKIENFRLIEEELPELQDGEILGEALFLSVDPYMRFRQVPEGTTMIGTQVAKIVKSKNPKYSVGTLVVAYWGWRNYTIANPDVAPKNMVNGTILPLPDLGNLPPSLGLGAVGRPGNSAYFGFLEICRPQPGETVVVSGAAGAVGSLVGQIAKIKGCRVIGFSGSDDKVKWLVNDLGFDKAYNYKTADWNQSLKEAAPNGVDCYFDNVSGPLSTTVRNHMNNFGRIACCGAISTYNDNPGNSSMVPCVEHTFIQKQLTMEGFLVNRWVDRWMEGLIPMTKWIQEGKVKYQETYTEGFENMPQAFIEMLTGRNTGKAVVRA